MSFISFLLQIIQNLLHRSYLIIQCLFIAKKNIFFLQLIFYFVLKVIDTRDHIGKKMLQYLIFAFFVILEIIQNTYLKSYLCYNFVDNFIRFPLPICLIKQATLWSDSSVSCYFNCCGLWAQQTVAVFSREQPLCEFINDMAFGHRDLWWLMTAKYVWWL